MCFLSAAQRLCGQTDPLPPLNKLYDLEQILTLLQPWFRHLLNGDHRTHRSDLSECYGTKADRGVKMLVNACGIYTPIRCCCYNQQFSLKYSLLGLPW